ncbi:polyamine aminopropyltransferase [Roseicyclus persicicus]|uniref:polyamine aminopropyltransferase n=1 Tax=Roseicyclus persicicus TaxID=2650661 RepID=UPI001EF03AA5|nr:polyamine aminopropyltransferase [Roseibacterium persicicum]
MTAAKGPPRGPDVTPKVAWLLAATFVVAVAGLIYELIAATISSYLLGDSVRQFSFVIGVFLTAMGVGAYVSRYVGDALSGFVRAQMALGVVGGALGPVLFFSYAWYGAVGLPLYGGLVVIGILSGMEIPLITRVMKEIGAAEFRFENVLTADYVGALAASLAFPLLIIPNLSLMAASLAFGTLNLLVAGFSLWLFRDRLPAVYWAPWGVFLAAGLLALGGAERLVGVVDARLFEDEVILSETTPYQSIVLTRFDDRYRLFLDHSIQFDSLDEHRYHEALVHPAMGLAPRVADVLVLGGGDGMAVREVLRHPGVERVRLVDLDPRVTELFSQNPDLVALNAGALTDPRVEIVNADAWAFLAGDDGIYDVIIADLPDPKSIALSKLYSIEFYAMMAERLSGAGIFVTQAGSPTFAPGAFWTVEATLAATRNPLAPGEGLGTLPYHVYVPSFGDWGFVLAAPMLPAEGRVPALPEGLRHLTPEVWAASRAFGPDQGPREVEVNSIQGHPLVAEYERGWGFWFR